MAEDTYMSGRYGADSDGGVAYTEKTLDTSRKRIEKKQKYFERFNKLYPLIKGGIALGNAVVGDKAQARENELNFQASEIGNTAPQTRSVDQSQYGMSFFQDNSLSKQSEHCLTLNICSIGSSIVTACDSFIWDGTTYTYKAPRQGKGAAATGLGAFLTGLLGVGIGEVVMPQLVKSNKVPIPVAAATSVFTVIVVVASASFTQISTLIALSLIHI